MPVIGFSISSINAERKNVTVNRLDINSMPKITSVEERTITVAGKVDALAVGFEFLTTYNPDVGQIKINGELVYTSEDSKKVLKVWNKDKKLPDAVDAEIKNFLFRKCLTIGIDMSENLQLPPPLAFPMIVPKKEEERTRYIG